MEHISKHLTKVPDQDAGQIGKHYRNGAETLTATETKFLEALGGQRIKAGTSEQIIAELRYLMTLVGIRKENYPEKQDIVIMVDHIQQHHGTLTIRELRLAIDMAVTMQLDFNPTAYQNISVLYLNEMLGAYKRWSAQAYKQLRPGGDRDSERAAPDWSPHIYERKSANALRREIQEGYQNFKTGILPSVHYVPYEWWAQLVDDGFIEYDNDATVRENKRCSQLTPDEKRRLHNGQQMVWLLFEMARQKKVLDIYIKEA
jgi:hypothetical protein